MSPDLQSKMLAVFIVSLIVPGCAAIPLDSTFLPFSGLNVRKSQLNPNRRSLLQAYTYSTLTEAPSGSKTFNGVCSSQFACTTGSCSATSLTAYFDTTIPSYAVDSDPSTVFSTDDSEGLRYLRLAYSSPISVAGGVIYADNANRLYSFMIWVGNDPTYPGTNVKCYQSTTASYNNFAPIVETFSCGVTGKYVYVSDSLAADYFQINELYIYKYSNVSNQVVSSSGSQCVCPDGLSIVNGACSCSPGYFLSASTCQICPANSYCPSGSTSPTSCGSGSLSSQGSASISSCQSPQIYVNISIDGASSTMNQSQFQNALPSNVVLTQYQDVLVAVQASCFQGYYCPMDTTTPIPCPAGTYNSLPNIADPSGCLTCPQGSYCPSASMLPTSCAAGSYMIGIGASQQSNCVTCPSGNYCPLGTITPSNCSAGTYNPVLNGTGIASCLACPAGEYCPLATTTPSVCSAGSYRGSTGGAQQGDCTTCPTGNYCPASSVNPTNCSAGTYEPSTGGTDPTSCLTCPAGEYCPLATTTPSVCSAGSYRGSTGGAQQGDCTTCPTGNYCPASSVNPTNCSAGTYEPSTGGTAPASCLACPAGQYCPLATTTPSVCSAGSYRGSTGGAQQGDCTTCPTGNYCPANSVNPTNCSAGTYEPSTGGTAPASCLACPAGEYCPLATTTPSVCSAGSYRGTTGGAQQGDCTTCPSGNYCPASSVNPTNCSAGTYEPSTGGTAPASCLACPTGNYCPISSVNPTNCNAGTYEPSTGGTAQSSCLACPAGQFCPLGTTTPSVCSAGSYRGSTGGAQQGDCTTCPTGNYCPASSVNPTNCSTGTYEPSAGGTAPASCLACPAGQYCPLATTTPSVCSAGSYRGSTGGAQQGDCTACPKGNYCPANSVNPTNCSAGTYEPSTGGTAPASCLACPAGQYCPLATTTPSVCSAGSYRGTTGGTQQGDCTACPTGNYCPASSVNPINCSAGTYEPSTGGSAPSSCLSCPQADYCPVATTSPTQCSANTYSLGSASVCSSCPGYSTSAVASINCTCINGHYQSGSVTGGGSAGLSETMTGLDSYFTLSGYGASKLSFVTFNGYANITVLQGTVITMASALYGASHFSMNIYSNLASIATYTISMYSLDPSFQGMYTIDFVPYTNSISGCSSYLYTNGVTGSGTASLTWNTATVPPGMYYVMATTGGLGTIRNAGYILVATPSPATYNLPLALTTQPRWILVALGDTVVFTQSSGLTNIYIDSEPNSDSAGTISNREATGVFPFTWSTSSASVSSQYIVSTDNGAMLFYIIIVPRPTSTASPYLTCPNCSTGTYSLAGNTACTNCGYGNYSAAVSSSCTTCPVGTMCNSITTPTPVNCGLGNYQGSTGQSSCMTCPQNQYCASPTTSTPITCPTHTSSVAGSSSLLQCRCTQGFVCTYTKRITAVITLNSTLYNFNNDVGGVKTALINAVATAAGVTASKVTINSAAQKTGNRRLLELSGSHSFIDVHTVIEGAERLRGLDLHLAKHSATLHKDHSWQEAHTLSARPARPMLASR